MQRLPDLLQNNILELNEGCPDEMYKFSSPISFPYIWYARLTHIVPVNVCEALLCKKALVNFCCSVASV